MAGAAAAAEGAATGAGAADFGAHAVEAASKSAIKAAVESRRLPGMDKREVMLECGRGREREVIGLASEPNHGARVDEKAFFG